MSRLEELIQEYCPDGVEYKQLSTISSIIRGKRITKKDLKENGLYPVISGGITPLGFFNDYNRVENTITIAQYGTAGYVDWQLNKFWANDVCYSIIPNIGINNKFLYYSLVNIQSYIYSLKTNAIPAHLPQDKLSNILIPNPPLEVQDEIVRILDQFTELNDTLNSELLARQKQYEYYRNSLLNFEDLDTHLLKGMLQQYCPKGVELKELGKIGEFIRGKRFVRDDIQEVGIPCIHYGDLYTFYGISAIQTKNFLNSNLARKMRYAKQNDIVIVQAGENDWDIGIGVAWLGEQEVAIHDACYIFKHNLNPKYVSYFLRTDSYHKQIKKYVSSGKICSINSDGIGKALMPVPPIEIQKEIVRILDKYDTLVNDIKVGLPAEIEARQKQYEYYRDKLLTFKELES